MARYFVQFLTIYSNENLPSSKKKYFPKKVHNFAKFLIHSQNFANEINKFAKVAEFRQI